MNNEIENLNKIFNINRENIILYLFCPDEELINITEEEYKKRLKDEYDLYKDKTIDNIYNEIKGLNNVSKENLNFLQQNYIINKITNKKNIYDQISTNLIDSFINECYKQNKKYFYERKWKNQSLFWKFINQKQNPKKIDFDNENIDELLQIVKKK